MYISTSKSGEVDELTNVACCFCLNTLSNCPCELFQWVTTMLMIDDVWWWLQWCVSCALGSLVKTGKWLNQFSRTQCLLPSQNCCETVHTPLWLFKFFFYVCFIVTLYNLTLYFSVSFHKLYFWLISSSLSLSFLTVWQRSRELWQVLHTYPAAAHAARWAGYRQHRPGWLCRVLFHQPTVCTPLIEQHRMRRMGNDLRKESPCSLPPTKANRQANIWPQLDQRPY